MSTEPACILVVDDDPDVRQICSRVLSKAGYMVLTAEDAAQAREHIEHVAFDLLILDIHLPNEDGISLLKHVHKIHPGLPAILITGYAAASTVMDAIRLNVREYLCKPFTMQKLLEVVAASLQDSKGAPKTRGDWFSRPSGW